jgi:hypothetical protein
MTQWFVLPRFGSKEPSPCWGGHKDRVSFNPFPLSNGHLDRVSFLLNSHGSLRPPQRPPHNWCLLLAYKTLENKNEERRKRSKNKSSKNTSKTLSLVTRCLECIWDLERLWFFWIVSCIDCTSSCIEWDVWKTWMIGVEVVGGLFIALTTNSTVGEGCCRWAHRTVRCTTGHCLVRQPHHPTVRVLTVLTVGALTSWGTEQFGAAPDRHCSLSGAPSGAALTLRKLSTHCSRCRWPLESTVALASRCSAGTPDSPVNYSGVALQKPEGSKFEVIRPWAPDTVWCHTGQSGAPDQGSLRFLLLLSFEP